VFSGSSSCLLSSLTCGVPVALSSCVIPLTPLVFSVRALVRSMTEHMASMEFYHRNCTRHTDPTSRKPVIVHTRQCLTGEWSILSSGRGKYVVALSDDRL
jgi:hypothetical protein